MRTISPRSNYFFEATASRVSPGQHHISGIRKPAQQVASHLRCQVQRLPDRYSFGLLRSNHSLFTSAGISEPAISDDRSAFWKVATARWQQYIFSRGTEPHSRESCSGVMASASSTCFPCAITVRALAEAVVVTQLCAWNVTSAMRFCSTRRVNRNRPRHGLSCYRKDRVCPAATPTLRG